MKSPNRIELSPSTRLFVLCLLWLVGVTAVVIPGEKVTDVRAQHAEAVRIWAMRTNLRDAKQSVHLALAVVSLYELSRENRYLAEFRTCSHVAEASLKQLRASLAGNSELLTRVDKLDSLREKVLAQELNPLVDRISIKQATSADILKVVQAVQASIEAFDACAVETKELVSQPSKPSSSWGIDGLLTGVELTALTLACLMAGLSGKPRSLSAGALSDSAEQIGKDPVETNSTDLLEHAVDVICLIDAGFRFVSVNPASKASWGYSQSELLNKSVADFILPEDIQSTMNAVVGMEQSIDKITFENRLKRKDGKVIYLLWSVHWSASYRGLFCVVHDITERKESEQLKRELMAMISHDLRTPLSSIKALLELIEDLDGQLNAKTLQLVGQGRSQTERLIDLVNDLLDIEKMQSGKFTLQCEQTSTTSILNASVESVSRLAEMRGIRIELPSQDCAVAADPARMVQVVINLLSNAIKFSPSNTVIKLDVQDDDADFVRIIVRDSGKGIAQSQLGRVFEKFEQADGSEDAQYKGTGLGLAICKSIVEQHGGKIGVESEPGVGSTFWFLVPKPQRETCIE